MSNYKFEVGDRVVLRHDSPWVKEGCPDNPLDVVGTVVKQPYSGSWISVEWDNGESNLYKKYDTDLEYAMEDHGKILAHAKELYRKHLNLLKHQVDEFMWKQCSPEYQRAWITIAQADLEDPLKEEME